MVVRVVLEDEECKEYKVILFNEVLDDIANASRKGSAIR